LLLPYREEIKNAQVRCRKVDNKGKPVGKANHNPFLDTRRYLVELKDVAVLEYDVNTIAESIYSQINNNVHYMLLLNSIVDHRKLNSSLTHENSFITTKSGKR